VLTHGPADPSNAVQSDEKFYIPAQLSIFQSRNRALDTHPSQSSVFKFVFVLLNYIVKLHSMHSATVLTT